MTAIVVERTFAQPVSDADLTAAGAREKSCLQIYGVTWRRSLLSADRMRMICQYDAADAESVRKAQREAGNVFDRVWGGTVIE